MNAPKTASKRKICRSLSLAPALLLWAPPAAADWPAWIERWLFNPTERTERALESVEAGAVENAGEPLETALRLRSDHPVVQYNAGTARLVATSGDARSLLEAAAERGPRELIPSARYNLGNALMAGQDLPGAIAAYKQALRLDPALENAKFNLELAQRLLAQQAQNQEQPQEQQQDPEQQPQEQQDQKQQEQEQEQEDQEQQPEQKQEQEQEPRQPQDQPPPQQDSRQQQKLLPQFEDLPDMTAEEAAAILEAVENMEREQRRKEALEAAKKNLRGKKDW